jgi:hypothetical protein
MPLTHDLPMINACRSALFLLPLALLLAACAGPAAQPDPGSARYTAVVSDQRPTPFEVAKMIEDDGVRFHLGEAFLGAGLMEVLHREIALQLPKQPRQHTLEVTDLELSAFVPGSSFPIDPSRTVLVRGRYRPAPGSLVLEDLGAEAITRIRARIDYRLNGQPVVEEVNDNARLRDLHRRAGELYDQAIGRMVARILHEG